MTPSSLSSIAVFLCAFICCISHASALSNPSSRVVNGFNNFPGTSTTTTVVAATTPRKLKASDLNKQPNRQQQKSYVPDGLTEEQYRKIKNEELIKQQSMNFGMWGPRFKQTDGDPEFWNWFSSPTLWTGGFASNYNGKNNIGGGSSASDNNGFGGRTIANLLVLYLRRYALAYLMMLLSTQMLVKSVLPISKKVWSAKLVASVRILLPIVTLKPLTMVASLAERREVRWLQTNGTTKLATVLAVFISVVSFALR